MVRRDQIKKALGSSATTTLRIGLQSLTVMRPHAAGLEELMEDFRRENEAKKAHNLSHFRHQKPSI
jgi:hypothetical protein